MPDPRDFLTVLRPDRLAMMQQPTGPSGLAGVLARPGVNEGLLSFGLNMLASDQKRETFGQSLLRSVGAGAAAYEEKKADAEYNTILNDPAIPEQMRGVLKAIGRREGSMILAQQMMTAPAPRATTVLTQGAQLVDAATGEIVAANAAPSPEAPSDVRSFEAYRSMSPEDRASYLEYLRAKTASTTVNVGGQATPEQQALGNMRAALVTDGFSSAQGAADKVDTIDRLITVTQSDAFARVSGPIEGRIGEMKAAFGGDTEALEALANFQAGGGLMTMQQLEAFTGPKTDFEFLQAQRLAFNDPTMTPEQIQAGLRFHKRVAEQEAVRWADRMLGLQGGFSASDVGPQLELARTIKSRFGTAQVNDPAGIR